MRKSILTEGTFDEWVAYYEGLDVHPYNMRDYLGIGDFFEGELNSMKYADSGIYIPSNVIEQVIEISICDQRMGRVMYWQVSTYKGNKSYELVGDNIAVIMESN